MNDTTQHNTTQHNIEIYIATHKKYTFFDIDGFIPIHTGKAINPVELGIIGDNTGDNISAKNKNYCELTALYWSWKNSNADILGLYHYRRYFGVWENGELKILDNIGLQQALASKNTVLVPYLHTMKDGEKPMTTREVYEKHHSLRDWLLVKDIISQDHPEYITAFETLENSTSMYFCNLFVAHRKVINEYCEWLFSILFKLEQQIDISNYDDYQQRIYGFLSERLFNVFIEKHRAELNLVSMPTISIPEPIKTTSNYVPQ